MIATKRSEVNEGLEKVSDNAGQLGQHDLPESRVVLSGYLRDYQFVAVENLATSGLVNEPRSRAPNGTYHIVLFVKKSPTPGAHARSLLVR